MRTIYLIILVLPGLAWVQAEAAAEEIDGHFEKTRLKELADLFPDLADGLNRLIDRLVDLLPLTRQHYYHPEMKGSWSLRRSCPPSPRT